MGMALDLLDQAEHIASVDTGRPKQANLRRAISSAYYAVFHLLVGAGARRFSPRRPASLEARIGRAFAHREMKQVCRSIIDRKPSLVLVELAPGGFSTDLESVARAFVELQEARHKADYDLAVVQSRTEAIDSVRQAGDAFAAWERIKKSDEAVVFFAALLFAGRWSK